MDNHLESPATEIYTPQTLAALGMHNALGYLIAQVKRRLHEILEQELAPLGLTSAQFVVIMRLSQQPDLTAADFSRILEYDPGAMKRLLDRIEHKGFIHRVRSAEDKRSVRLALTDSGQRLQPEILPKVCHAYNRLLQGFNPEEARQLEQLLLRILANE
jgi:DNA-binding MarR family transcriptional regulator